MNYFCELNEKGETIMFFYLNFILLLGLREREEQTHIHQF